MRLRRRNLSGGSHIELSPLRQRRILIREKVLQDNVDNNSDDSIIISLRSIHQNQLVEKKTYRKSL